MTNNTMILTKNTDKLRAEVAAHVATDSIVQGDYWNDKTHRGCFIGCLAKGNHPAINEKTYGLPVMMQDIAANIFEALPIDEAKAFFAALPDAVGCDGKDLSKVGWRFLVAELRSLPPQKTAIQGVIDQVVAGLDMVISGKEWTTAQAVLVTADAVATAAAAAAAAIRADVAADVAAANWAAARTVAAVAAGAAAIANADWAVAARATNAWVAAARAADAWVAAVAADITDATWTAARLQQRDLLLRLISEAPVVGEVQ